MTLKHYSTQEEKKKTNKMQNFFFLISKLLRVLLKNNLDLGLTLRSFNVDNFK